MINWIIRHWRRLLLWLLVLLPLFSLLLVNLILLVLIYWPRGYEMLDGNEFTPRGSSAVVAAHGVKDSPSSWALPLLQVLRERGVTEDLFAVDWQTYAQNPLRCAIDGSRLGRRIGEMLVAAKQLQHVHLVGHSCGAFVIYNICRTIKRIRPELMVQTTYLDPVSIYGPWFRYGVSHFGDCADYSDAYIDTEDTVTGSNEPLLYAHTYDVTALRQYSAVAISPHNWPTLYYRELVRAGRAPDLQQTPELAQRKPSGILKVPVE